MDAISITYNVTNWLADSHQPRVLHVFDHACNLINETGEVLSVVTPHIGEGPFHLVVGENVCFSKHLMTGSPISAFPEQLILGNLWISTLHATRWDPCPAWENLHAQSQRILFQLGRLQCTPFNLPNPLSTHLAMADLPSALRTIPEIAGAGPGLTPAGDDFIMGALYALWILQPPPIARRMAEEMARAARPLTTSLSAAYLQSAGRGEAGIRWHVFLEALRSAGIRSISDAMNEILTMGATSGADALAGLISTLMAYVETDGVLCHS